MMTKLNKLAVSALLGVMLSASNVCFALDFPFLSNNSESQATTNNQNDQSAQDGANKSPSWSSTAQEIILHAISQTGVKYKYGGITPDSGFDCSGFVRYVFQQAANLTLPHGARAISQVGTKISKDELQPGDLVFFNTLRSVTSHVGIYVGNNRFIHSPSAGGTISVTDMNDAYWAKRFTGARHIEANDLAAIETNKTSK
jgi:cell wall-associated NlpC family hydrolase